MASSFDNYVSIKGNVLSTIDDTIPIMTKRADKSMIAGKDLVWLYEAFSRRTYTNHCYPATRSMAADGTISWDVDHDLASGFSKLDLDLYWFTYDYDKAQIDNDFAYMVNREAKELIGTFLSCIDDLNATTFFEKDASPLNVPRKLLNAAEYNGYAFLSDCQIINYNSPIFLSSMQLLFDVTKFNISFLESDYTLPNEQWDIRKNTTRCTKTNDNGPTDFSCEVSGTLSVINGYSNPKIGFFARYDSRTGDYGSIDTSLINNSSFILAKFTVRDFMVPRYGFVFVYIHYNRNLNQAGDEYSYKYAAIPVAIESDGNDSYGNPVYKVKAPTLKDLYKKAGFDAPSIIGLTKTSYWQVIYTIKFVGWVFDIQDA